MKAKHLGNEMKLTYHAWYDLWYLEGHMAAVEKIIDELEEPQEKQKQEKPWALSLDSRFSIRKVWDDEVVELQGKDNQVHYMRLDKFQKDDPEFIETLQIIMLKKAGLPIRPPLQIPNP